jgi:large subunit ribosomal protein L35
MLKLKTKKGAVKRFRMNKKGKIKYAACGKSHLATNKKPGRIRKLRKKHIVRGVKENKFLKRLLPYG